MSASHKTMARAHLLLLLVCLYLAWNVSAAANITAAAVAETTQLNAITSQTAPKLKLWPLDGIDIAVLLIISVCLSLAGGAGIGGGAVLVPIFIMLRGWPTAIAVAMSNVTVLGGSLANFICNVNRHRANGARTIDWELILMMEPTTIAGALFGAILNKLLPNYITTYLLTAMLTFMALRLYQKGCQAYAKETALLKAAKHAAKADHQHQHHLHHASRPASSAAAAATSLAIRTRRELQQNSGSSQTFGSSLSRSINRSISRLNAPLLAEVSGTAAVVGSSLQQRRHIQTDAPSTAKRHGSTNDLAEAGAAAAAAAATVVLGEDERPLQHPAAAAAAAVEVDAQGAAAAATWLPAMLRASSHRQLLDALDCSAFCQGDGLGDVETVVALPLDPTFSSSSDASDTSAGPAASEPDLEAAFYDTNDDAVDLSRPLLAAAPPAGPTAVTHLGDDRDGAGVDVGGSDVHQWDVDSNTSEARLLEATAAMKGRLAAPAVGVPAAVSKHPVRESCIPLPQFCTLLLLSAWVVASDIAQSSTVCGSWQYWLVTLSVLLPVAIILLISRQFLLRKYRHDDLAPGHVLPEGQLHWTATTTLLYPALCSTAGLIAGLFGIGGGVVKGPLMLELGVPADVAAATSATMIMFTAGSACVVYSRFGQLLVDYGTAMIVIGFTITLCSQLLTFVLIKLLGRRSVIVFMMVVLMSIACSIMYVQSVIITTQLVQHPEELKHFGQLCPAERNGLGALFQQLLLRFTA